MKGFDRVLFFAVGIACLFIFVFVRMASTPVQVAQASNELVIPKASIESMIPQVDPVFLPDPESPEGEQTQATQPAKQATKQVKKQQKKTSPTQAARSQDECSIGLRYPESIRRWCNLIERYAGEENMDPRLIAAVILQESGGDPQAYSYSGAVGLMQVMPRDGLAANFICSGGPCFSSRPTMEELFDPEFNISYGTRMLGGLVRKYGDVREALYSYGPHDVGYYYADLVLGIFNAYQ